MAGIVRRIDDLGRIVIPKEIRRSLKIKDGESLDVEALNDTIILKRYSNFLDIEKFLENLINVIGNIIKKDILIFDNSKVVAQYSKKIVKKKGIKVTDDLYKLFDSRRLLNKYCGSIFIEEQSYSGNFLLSSIIPNGDIVGYILFYSEENFTEIDRIMLELLAKTLMKYIEQ